MANEKFYKVNISNKKIYIVKAIKNKRYNLKIEKSKYLKWLQKNLRSFLLLKSATSISNYIKKVDYFLL